MLTLALLYALSWVFEGEHPQGSALRLIFSSATFKKTQPKNIGKKPLVLCRVAPGDGGYPWTLLAPSQVMPPVSAVPYLTQSPPHAVVPSRTHYSHLFSQLFFSTFYLIIGAFHLVIGTNWLKGEKPALLQGSMLSWAPFFFFLSFFFSSFLLFNTPHDFCSGANV